MSQIFDFSAIQTSRFIPTGNYNLKVVSIESKPTRESGCLMFVIESVVTAPSSQAGKTQTEWHVFGKRPFASNSEDAEFQAYAQLDDPQAADPLTARFSFGMRDFKRQFEACGVDFSKPLNVADLSEKAAIGALEYGASITLGEDKNTGKERNRSTRFFKKGTEELGAVAAKTAGKPAVRAAGATGAAAAHSAKNRSRPTEEDQD